MPYEEFELHDFDADTLDAQPDDTTRYGAATSWLVKEVGPGGSLSRSVLVDASTGTSFLCFSHTGAGDDLHNYPDKIVACVKFDTTKTGQFVFGFNCDNGESEDGLFGICFEPNAGKFYSAHVVGTEVAEKGSDQLYTFDSSKWYVISVYLSGSGYTIEARFYPLDNPSSVQSASKHYSGFSSYSAYLGDPHACLVHIGSMQAWACWAYTSTYASPNENEFPPTPGVEGDGDVDFTDGWTIFGSTDVFGDGAVIFADFALTGSSGGAGSVDFPDFGLGSSLTGQGNVWIEEDDWAVYVGHGGAVAAVAFATPVIAATGGQTIRATGEIEFPEPEIEAHAGGHAGVDFPAAEIEAVGHVQILGRAALNFPAFDLSATGLVGITTRCPFTQNVNFPNFDIEASGTVRGVNVGIVDFSPFRLQATGLISVHGGGSVGFASFAVEASGYDLPTGDGEVDFADFEMEGYAEDVNDWYVLRHDRFPVNG